MKKDIDRPKVENVAFAIAEDKDELGNVKYDVYLINMRDDIMEGIIITSRGYLQDENTGETKRSSTLRHSLEVLLPGEVARIEPILPDVFGLTNEYFLSFWVNDVIFDKKFIFLPGTIQESNMIYISELDKKGVLIK